jgi:predicted Zn-ribbon and HTH transcriptional regulator
MMEEEEGMTTKLRQLVLAGLIKDKKDLPYFKSALKKVKGGALTTVQERQVLINVLSQFLSMVDEAPEFFNLMRRELAKSKNKKEEFEIEEARKPARDVGLECQECGKKFRSKSPKYGTTKCPKCKSTDIDLDYHRKEEVDLDEGQYKKDKDLEKAWDHMLSKVKHWGSHPSLSGAKKFAKTRGFNEEVELDEIRWDLMNKGPEPTAAIIKKAGKQLKDYALKSGGIDKDDFLTTADVMLKGQLPRAKQIPSDTAPREHVHDLMAKTFGWKFVEQKYGVKFNNRRNYKESVEVDEAWGGVRIDDLGMEHDDKLDIQHWNNKQLQLYVDKKLKATGAKRQKIVKNINVIRKGAGMPQMVDLDPAKSKYWRKEDNDYGFTSFKQFRENK